MDAKLVLSPPESSLCSQHTFSFLKSTERERESKKERDKEGYERKEGKGIEYVYRRVIKRVKTD